MPLLVRAGAVLLGLGIAGDVVYHLIHGIRPHVHAPGTLDVALAVHLIVVAGAALCMTGVIATGIRSARSAHLRRHKR